MSCALAQRIHTKHYPDKLKNLNILRFYQIRIQLNFNSNKLYVSLLTLTKRLAELGEWTKIINFIQIKIYFALLINYSSIIIIYN